MTNVSRRKFLKTAAVAAGSVMMAPVCSWAGEEEKKATIYVVEGKDVKSMLAKGIAQLGGWTKIVKSGKLATVKPNAAWISTPEEGGNTDPVLVGEVVAACKAAGASRIVVPENPCSPADQAFVVSGIKDAVEKAGGEMYRPEKEHYRSVELPRAKNMKTADVVIDVLDTGCLINMPVAKNHDGAVLTLSMKNWMGSVSDRGFMHRSDLHQCIADLSTLIKPTLIIMDATRIMLTGGPRGPGTLANPHQIILGTDPVAVDAYAATLFEKKPFDVPHVRMAHEMGTGCGDLSKVNVVRLQA